MLLFLCLFCYCFIVSCGKFGPPYLVKAQQPQEQRYPFLSVCAVVWCVQAMVWLPASWIFNVPQTLMRTVAHSLYGQRKSLHWKLKIPCHTWESNPRQYCAWLFSWTLCHLHHLAPFPDSRFLIQTFFKQDLLTKEDYGLCRYLPVCFRFATLGPISRSQAVRKV